MIRNTELKSFLSMIITDQEFVSTMLGNSNETIEEAMEDIQNLLDRLDKDRDNIKFMSKFKIDQNKRTLKRLYSELYHINKIKIQGKKRIDRKF